MDQVARRMTPAPSTVAVTLDRATFRYAGAHDDAVHDVSMSVGAGEVVAVAGQSGSGKSTLARLVTGLLRPTSGAVHVAGLDTRQVATQRVARHAGLVYQHPGHQLFAATVSEELRLGPRNAGVGDAEATERAREVARALAVEDVLDAHPRELPIGTRKRVAIAAILAMRPRVLVLDEPTVGQDPADVRRVSDVIQDQAARGTSVLIVSHELRFVSRVADRVVVLAAGRVRRDGATPDVLADRASLDSAGLDPPPLVDLALALHLRAPSGVPVTVEEVVDAIARPRAGGRP